jgi:hypothetical protein
MIILYLMLFMHILDDFVLQSFSLSNLKQKSFWKDKRYGKFYDDDYIISLIIHAFSWAFMIHIPLMVIWYLGVLTFPEYYFGISLLINTTLHAIIDNEKANNHSLNLVQDQILHIIQIVLTFMIFYYIT